MGWCDECDMSYGEYGEECCPACGYDDDYYEESDKARNHREYLEDLKDRKREEQDRHWERLQKASNLYSRANVFFESKIYTVAESLFNSAAKNIELDYDLNFRDKPRIFDELANKLAEILLMLSKIYADWKSSKRYLDELDDLEFCNPGEPDIAFHNNLKKQENKHIVKKITDDEWEKTVEWLSECGRYSELVELVFIAPAFIGFKIAKLFEDVRFYPDNFKKIMEDDCYGKEIRMLLNLASKLNKHDDADHDPLDPPKELNRHFILEKGGKITHKNYGYITYSNNTIFDYKLGLMLAEKLGDRKIVAIKAGKNILATLEEKGTIQLWSLPDLSFIRMFTCSHSLDDEHHTTKSHQIINFSPDDRLIAIYDEGKTKLINICDGKRINSIEGRCDGFSPDGRFLSTIYNDKKYIWELDQGNFSRISQTLLYEAVISPDWKVYTDYDSDEGYTVLRKFPPLNESKHKHVECLRDEYFKLWIGSVLAFSPAGKLLMTEGLECWDVINCELKWKCPINYDAHWDYWKFNFSPDQKLLAISEMSDVNKSCLSIISISTGEKIKLIDFVPEKFAFTTNNLRLVVGESYYNLKYFSKLIVDTTSADLEDIEKNISDVSISKDEKNEWQYLRGVIEAKLEREKQI